jgi:hypothetical protein
MRPILAVVLLAEAYCFDASAQQAEEDESGEETANRGERSDSTETAEEESLTIVELSQLCHRLAENDENARRDAATRIIASGPSSVQTIHRRLKRELRSAPGDLEKLLDRLSPDVRGQKLPPRHEDPPFDVLPPLLAEPRDDDSGRTVVEATEVVTLLRALLEVESTPATRLIIQYGVRERGVFKAEVARNIVRLGEKSLPALILTTQHPRESIAELAHELLDWRNRTSRGRQVQVRDSGTLAEILAVYGELSDRDTIPVLLSFSGSESSQVRAAARSSLLRYGTAILWPARTRYENFTGEEPSRRWGWEELARRLFEAQDRARMAQAEQAMSEGLRLARAGHHEAMLAQFEKLLSRWPDYERRNEMVPGILDYAQELESRGERSRARRLRAQVLLLDPSETQRSEIESKLLLYVVESGLARGIADPESLDRLDQLEHEDDRVEDLRAHIEERTERPPPHTYRLVAAIGLALLGLGLLGLLVMRAMPSSKGPAQAKKKDDEGEESD